MFGSFSGCLWLRSTFVSKFMGNLQFKISEYHIYILVLQSIQLEVKMGSCPRLTHIFLSVIHICILPYIPLRVLYWKRPLRTLMNSRVCRIKSSSGFVWGEPWDTSHWYRNCSLSHHNSTWDRCLFVVFRNDQVAHV